MNTTFNRTVGASAALLFALTSAGKAVARDRPGTPFNLMVQACGDFYSREPAVCIKFQNGAKEKVSFAMDWTRNGQPMTGRPSTNIDCDVGWRTAGLCTAMSNITLGSRDPKTESFHDWQAIAFRNLDWATEYCFRFMAVDAGGVWSDGWSAFGCARTQPKPAAPQAPSNPRAEFFPATDGRGSTSGPLPARVLIEWTAPNDLTVREWVGGLYVEDRKSISGSQSVEVKDRFDRPTPTRMLLPVGGPPDSLGRYRAEICARNIAGSRCATAMTRPTALSTEAAVRDRASPAAIPAGPQVAVPLIRTPALSASASVPSVGFSQGSAAGQASPSSTNGAPPSAFGHSPTSGAPANTLRNRLPPAN